MRRPIDLYLLMLGAALLLSCGLGKSLPPWETRDDGSETPHDTMTVTTPPDAPIVDYSAIPNNICATHIGIVGNAQPSSDVIVKGGEAGSSRTSATSSGEFCVPVALSPNQDNTFEVRAWTQDGGFGDITTVTVRHTCAGGVTPNDPNADPNNVIPTNSQPTPTGNTSNIAAGAEVTAKHQPKTGSLPAIVDGNPSSYAGFDSDDNGLIPNPFCIAGAPDWMGWAWDGWVKVSLSSIREVSGVKVVWRDAKESNYAAPREKQYAMRYTLWASRVPTDPGDPNSADGQWTEIETVVAGDGGDDIFNFSAPITARHIAITMQLDGHCLPVGWSNWPHWWDLSWNEHFALSEIEVYAGAATQTSIPAAGNDVCMRASGGVL